MATWEDIQTALTNFWNWATGLVSSIPNVFTDTLGELGAWLYGGIKWLADKFKEAWDNFANWFYQGLKWVGDKIKEGYEAVAQWISGGLQWIGSGLSWIGQQLYAFGQWLWNGIVWTARTIAGALESFVNWLWEQLVNIWNFIVDLIKSWVASLNDHLNDWIKSLRDKFKQFVLINTAIPAQFKSVDLLVEGKLKEGLLGMFLSPVAGAVLGELLDVIVPRPASERVIIFPEIEVPTITPSGIVIEKPEIPITPAPTELPTTPMYPPAVGYRPTIEKTNVVYTSYDIIVQGIRARELLSKAVTEYSIELSEVLISELTSKTITEYDLITALFETRELLSKAVAEVETILRAGTFITKTNFAGTTYDILVSGISGLHRYNYARTLYDVYVSAITKLRGISKAGAEVSLIPSIGVAIVTTPSTRVVIETYMPQELPQYQEGTGTSYEIEVIPPEAATRVNKVGTSYTIFGVINIALTEAIIYLGETEYEEVQIVCPFNESFAIQGIEVSKSEPENAMSEEWYISIG